MADAARKLGYKYLGIADHSQSLNIANGLSPERVREQQKEIDALNAKFKGFRIFKGTECDILADGSLDYDDEVLASFDYVVASVHTLFNQPQEEMTARIIKAIEHPRVTMLGHATGRLLLKRDGYKVDLEAVLQAAAKAGTMIEINANPLPPRPRLDSLQARQGARRQARHQSRRPFDGRSGLHALRRRCRPPRLAGKEGRVQHAAVGAGSEGVGETQKGAAHEVSGND